MKVYLDMVFLINFFFDFLLLKTVSYLKKQNVTIKKLLFGSLVGSSSLIFLFLPSNQFLLLLGKIVISILMLLATFQISNKKTLFHMISSFYIVSILLGGFLYFFKLQFQYQHTGLIFFSKKPEINFFYFLLISPIILYWYLKEIKKLKIERSHYYSVEIYFDQKKLTLRGFLDTGNQLYDPYHHRPVLLVHSDYFDVPIESATLVPYQTLEHSGIIRCKKATKVIIDQKHTFCDVLIGKSDTKFYIPETEVLLHPDFFS